MYNFLSEFLEKNEDLHDNLKSQYQVLDEGSNSVIYQVSDERIIKVFSFKNFSISNDIFNSESSKYKIFNNLNYEINNALSNSSNYWRSLERIMVHSIFDKSYQWLMFCDENKNKHFPTIHNICIDFESCSYIVEMDYLEPFYKENNHSIFLSVRHTKICLKLLMENISTIQEDSNYIYNKIIKSLSIKNISEEKLKNIKYLINFFKKNILNTKCYNLFLTSSDFTEDNILYRGNLWILNDPVL